MKRACLFLFLFLFALSVNPASALVVDVTASFGDPTFNYIFSPPIDKPNMQETYSVKREIARSGENIVDVTDGVTYPPYAETLTTSNSGSPPASGHSQVNTALSNPGDWYVATTYQEVRYEWDSIISDSTTWQDGSTTYSYSPTFMDLTVDYSLQGTIAAFMENVEGISARASSIFMVSGGTDWTSVTGHDYTSERFMGSNYAEYEMRDGQAVTTTLMGTVNGTYDETLTWGFTGDDRTHWLELGILTYAWAWNGGTEPEPVLNTVGGLLSPELLDYQNFINLNNIMFQPAAYNASNPILPPPPAPVPEPTTMLLFGTGLLGLAGFRRKKSKKV